MFLQNVQKVADEIAGKFAPGYERTYWDACLHGFAVGETWHYPYVSWVSCAGVVDTAFTEQPKLKDGWNWSSSGVYPVRIDETDV